MKKIKKLLPFALAGSSLPLLTLLSCNNEEETQKPVTVEKKEESFTEKEDFEALLNKLNSKGYDSETVSEFQEIAIQLRREYLANGITNELRNKYLREYERLRNKALEIVSREIELLESAPAPEPKYSDEEVESLKAELLELKNELESKNNKTAELEKMIAKLQEQVAKLNQNNLVRNKSAKEILLFVLRYLEKYANALKASFESGENPLITNFEEFKTTLLDKIPVWISNTEESEDTFDNLEDFKENILLQLHRIVLEQGLYDRFEVTPAQGDRPATYGYRYAPEEEPQEFMEELFDWRIKIFESIKKELEVNAEQNAKLIEIVEAISNAYADNKGASSFFEQIRRFDTLEVSYWNRYFRHPNYSNLLNTRLWKVSATYKIPQFPFDSKITDPRFEEILQKANEVSNTILTFFRDSANNNNLSSVYNRVLYKTLLDIFTFISNLRYNNTAQTINDFKVLLFEKQALFNEKFGEDYKKKMESALNLIKLYVSLARKEDKTGSLDKLQKTINSKKINSETEENDIFYYPLSRQFLRDLNSSEIYTEDLKNYFDQYIGYTKLEKRAQTDIDLRNFWTTLGIDPRSDEYESFINNKKFLVKLQRAITEEEQRLAKYKNNKTLFDSLSGESELAFNENGEKQQRNEQLQAIKTTLETWVAKVTNSLENTDEYEIDESTYSEKTIGEETITFGAFQDLPAYLNEKATKIQEFIDNQDSAATEEKALVDELNTKLGKFKQLLSQWSTDTNDFIESSENTINILKSRPSRSYFDIYYVVPAQEIYALIRYFEFAKKAELTQNFIDESYKRNDSKAYDLLVTKAKDILEGATYKGLTDLDVTHVEYVGDDESLAASYPVEWKEKFLRVEREYAEVILATLKVMKSSRSSQEEKTAKRAEFTEKMKEYYGILNDPNVLILKDSKYRFQEKHYEKDDNDNWTFGPYQLADLYSHLDAIYSTNKLMNDYIIPKK
ncbi:hypothetical protein [Mycoplasmopsis gallinacea]|uniref:Lipoprotein n=1 Tax=Mycoplasmopsis gallinacea TaxID=29556 RepID=A0A6H0V1M1_9BACT|nr:hypothetical protein [Mycoplasmopsis gallinacea]QIW62231.1 hypothetical protein GOQ20_02160 [Mycoplasmopsis gallinacea]